MRSILLYSLAGLMRRRAQAFWVGLSLVLAALLFSATLGVLRTMHKPFDLWYDRLAASHLLLLYDARVHDAEAIIRWWERQEEVKAISGPTPVFTLQAPLIHKGHEIDLIVELTEHSAQHLSRDRSQILQGREQPHPGVGEIWLPQGLANSQGIRPGDTLGIPVRDGLYPLVVSATILDPHYSATLINPTRAWVAPGALPLMFPAGEITRQMVGVRLRDAEAVDRLMQRFHAEIAFSGDVLDYDFFKAAYLSFYNIIALVLMVFSVLVILIALSSINATLSSVIATDYKQIGILKALGFTPAHIRIIYLVQYLILTLIALPVGAAGSLPMVRAIFASLIRSVGSINLDFSFLYAWGSAALVFLPLVGLIVGWRSGQASRIPPAPAIRSGAPVSAPQIGHLARRFSPDRIPLLAFLGGRFLAVHPRRSLFALGSLFMVVFLLTFAINLSHSLEQLKYNKPYWGFDNSDLQVSLGERIVIRLKHEQFLEAMQVEAQIRTIVPYSFYSLTVPAQQNKAPQKLYGRIYDGEMDAIGMVNLEGRHPRAAQEVALAINTSRKYDKQVGDSLDLFLEGQDRRFVVTGIYQDVSSLGQGFRLHASAVKSLNPLYEPNLYAIVLVEGIGREAFQAYLQRQFAEAVHVELSIEDQIEMMGLVGSMNASLSLLAVLFLGVIFAILFNDTLLSIRDHSRSLGIWKTVGFTPGQLRTALVWKTLILVGMSLLLGLPTALILSPSLISAMTSGVGLVDFPFVINLARTIWIIPGLAAFAAWGVWLASRRTLRIAPRLLMQPS